jgi:hypothetical protein
LFIGTPACSSPPSSYAPQSYDKFVIDSMELKWKMRDQQWKSEWFEKRSAGELLHFSSPIIED